jgi:twinkle protein
MSEEDRDNGIWEYSTSCPSCGSSDANQAYRHEDDTIDFYCFACKKYDRGTHERVEIEEETFMSSEELDKILDYPTGALEDRGIKESVSSLYGVRLGLSTQDGSTVVKNYCPDTKKGKITGYEVRDIANKRFSAIGDRKGSLDLWGANVAKKNGGMKLFITEGRNDAMALYQTIIDHTPAKYKSFLPSVVSLTRGSGGALKDLVNNREFVEGYKEVILVFDNDAPGEKATKDVLKAFPEFKVAKLPLKDANDMLKAKRGKELYDACVWKSSVARLGEVVQVDDNLIEEALTRPKMGLSTPWDNLDKLTYGVRPHTITILGAAPKQGKSEFKNQLVHHLAMVHDRKVGVYDLEVHPVKTLKQIASKEAKLNFLRPDIEYTDELLKTTLEKFKSNLYLYDRTGSRDWDDIKVAIEEQYLLDGVCEFFLDPLTALVSRYTSSEANDKLNEIMTDLADIVNKYPISIFCFSHINPKPKASKSHEQGGKVLSSEFTGSRSLEKWSNLGLGLERDRSDDCPEEKRNTSRVVILYDRDFGNFGSVEMFYNQETTEYLQADVGFN